VGYAERGYLLNDEVRFQPLATSTERVVAGGRCEPEGGTRIVRWGSWLGQK
jgi:hypothetical protein